MNSDIEGIKQRTVEADDLFMLRIIENPSVLVECGFLSNHDDEKKLADPDYQAKLADCIYKGICNYLGVK